MQLTACYHSAAEWVGTSQSQTTTGVWIANRSVERLPSDCTDGDLGAMVLRLLDDSEAGVSHPTDWRQFHEEYKERLGVKDYWRFVKK